MFQARRFAPLLTVVALLATTLLGGCSRDIHVFRSTGTSPKNVSVLSAATGEILWSMNVPVGQQLRLDFDRGESNEAYRSPNIPAKTMKWQLWTLDAIAKYGQKMKGGKKLDGDKIKLPEQQTLIDVQIRKVSSNAFQR